MGLTSPLEPTARISRATAASLKEKLHRSFDDLGWNDARTAFEKASRSCHNVSFENLFWSHSDSKSSPTSGRKRFPLVRALSLRGNDILSLLSSYEFPNLERLKLIFADHVVAEPDKRLADTTSSSGSDESIVGEISSEYGINNNYDVLIHFLSTTSRKQGHSRLRNLAIHDPFAMHLHDLITDDAVTSIRTVSIGGIPDVLRLVSEFLTQNSDAYDYLRFIGRQLEVWFNARDGKAERKALMGSSPKQSQRGTPAYDPEIDVAYLGWCAPEDVRAYSRSLLKYDTKEGYVSWPNGRCHRVVRSPCMLHPLFRGRD